MHAGKNTNNGILRRNFKLTPIRWYKNNIFINAMWCSPVEQSGTTAQTFNITTIKQQLASLSCVTVRQTNENTSQKTSVIENLHFTVHSDWKQVGEGLAAGETVQENKVFKGSSDTKTLHRALYERLFVWIQHLWKLLILSFVTMTVRFKKNTASLLTWLSNSCILVRFRKSLCFALK